VLPVIPVVYGRLDYTHFIPSSGLIDIRQYSSIGNLAQHLIQIQLNQTLYQSYFRWKKDFVWGGFSTYMTPFCDLCLRLHLDRTPHIVHDEHGRVRRNLSFA
jgi:alpha-1,3-fucosyltransferase